MKNSQISLKLGHSGILVTLVLFTIIYQFLFVRVLSRIGDEGSIVYGAQLVAHGALPYRDFFEPMGPASFYWLGLFFWLFGIKFTIARILLLITGVVTTLLIYWVTRRLYKGQFDYLPALFYMLISIPMWPGTSHHWDSNMFFLLAVAFFYLWQDQMRKRYLIMTGLISGFTSCFMMQKGFFLFLAFIILIIINIMQSRANRHVMIIKLGVRNIGIITIAYATVGMIVLVIYYSAECIHDLIYANLVFPLVSYRNINIVPYGYGLWELILPSYKTVLNILFPSTLSRGIELLIILPFIIILTLPVFCILFAVRSSTDAKARLKLRGSEMMICSITGVALWISEIHRIDFFHLIWGSPLLLIVSFVLFCICYEKKTIIYISSMVIVYISLIFLASFNLPRATMAGSEYATRRGIIHSYTADPALKYLVEEIPPKSLVFVYPYYPMYYFLSDQINPTRYSILLYGYNTEAQFMETINALEQKKVTYVLWDTHISGPKIKTWFPQYEHPAEETLILEKYLMNHYDELDIRNGFRIMKRKVEKKL